MVTFLLRHKLLIARQQLLTIGIRQRVTTVFSLQELLILARHQVLIVAFGSQGGLLLGRKLGALRAEE